LEATGATGRVCAIVNQCCISEGQVRGQGQPCKGSNAAIQSEPPAACLSRIERNAYAARSRCGNLDLLPFIVINSQIELSVSRGEARLPTRFVGGNSRRINLRHGAEDRNVGASSLVARRHA